jgi:hypothetical protein
VSYQNRRFSQAEYCHYKWVNRKITILRNTIDDFFFKKAKYEDVVLLLRDLKDELKKQKGKQ